MLPRNLQEGGAIFGKSTCKSNAYGINEIEEEISRCQKRS